MSTIAMFPSLYEVRADDRAVFGDRWCGPGTLRYGEWSLVARYEAAPESDGQTVEVDCLAMPARFYRLRVLPGVNSIGEPKGGYELSTGSSMAGLSAQVAQAIMEGMFGLDTPRGETDARASTGKEG